MIRTYSWLPLLLSILVACGGGATEPEADEQFVDPNPNLPPAEADRYAWGEANRGLPMPFDGSHLVAVGGDAYMLVDALTEKVEGEEQETIGELSGVYRMDGGSLQWERIAANPTGYGLRDMIAGPNDEFLYVLRGSQMWRWEFDTWVELAEAPVELRSLTTIPDTDPLGVYGLFDDDLGVYRYDTTNDTWELYLDGAAAAEGSGIPDVHPHDSATLAEGGVLYISRKWAIRDTEGQAGCVFAFDGEAWRDVTLNLRDTTDDGTPIHLLNATGNGWGPFGNIHLAPNGVDLIGTTEQGAFRYVAEQDRWVSAAAIWYGARVFVAGEYLVIGKERLEVYLNEFDRLSVGSYDLISGEELREVVSPREGLLVSRFRRRTEYRDETWEYQTIVVTEIDPEARVSSRNIDLDYATYVGGPDDDAIVEVAWDTQSNELWIAFNEDGAPDEVGHGTVMRRSEEGTEVWRFELDEAAHDMVAAPDGGVWVATDNAVLRFEVGAEEPTAQLDLVEDAGNRRIDIAVDGTLAVLAHKTVIIADSDGQRLRDVALERANVEDVAVSSETGLVYLVGFDNQNNGAPVQVPFLVAHDVGDLQFAWSRWAYDPSTLDNDMADSRLYRVVVGDNGDLYVAGEAAGGNTVFRWNGVDLETGTLITTDPYNTATNTGSEHKGYVARLDAASGTVEQGSMIIPRLSSGRGNTFRPRGLDVDADGNTYVSGVSAARFSGRDLNHINGQPVGDYAGGDPSLLVLSPDFTERLMWTTFVRDGASGNLRSVDVDGSWVALGATADKGQLFTFPDFGEMPWNASADDDLADAWIGLFRMR